MKKKKATAKTVIFPHKSFQKLSLDYINKYLIQYSEQRISCNIPWQKLNLILEVESDHKESLITFQELGAGGFYQCVRLFTS